MIQLISGIDTTSSALSAERTRMDVISQNLANIHTTRGLDGQPYQRQQVVFENFLPPQSDPTRGGTGPQMVRVARIEEDPRPPRWVHNPNHPDANAEGMVAMPNISVHEEMVDLITSSRTFEANLAVVKTAKQMAMETLRIGK